MLGAEVPDALDLAGLGRSTVLRPPGLPVAEQARLEERASTGSGESVAEALQRLRAAMSALPGTDRDVVVLAEPDVIHGGLAVTHPGEQHDRAGSVEGRAVELLRGDSDIRSLTLPRGRRPVGAHRDAAGIALPPYATRLSRLLRGVRRVLGPGGWEVEWVDDGSHTWLVAVFPRSQDS